MDSMANSPLAIQSCLIVDDHDGMRAFIRSLLSSRVMTLNECRDGAEAIAIYSAEEHTLVLMDIEMPNMDGLTATREIIRKNPSARIAIVSQHDTHEIRQLAIRAGAFAFLSKDDFGELDRFLDSFQSESPNFINDPSHH